MSKQQRKLDRVILDLMDIREDVDNLEVADKITEAITKLREVEMYIEK